MIEYRKAHLDCPACGQHSFIRFALETEHTQTETQHQIGVKHIDPIQCPKCKAYVLIEIASLYVTYQARELKTA